MKRYWILPALGMLSCIPAAAQWVVFDAANYTQNAMTYAANIKQLANQAEQIGHQMRQIQHMEDQLKRMGRMADYKKIVGYPQFRISVTLPTKVKTWGDSSVKVDGFGLFQDSRGGVFEPVAKEFRDFDGALVARDASVYKAPHEITNKVDNFKEVQADVYTRREDLKQAIVSTSDALQVAETDAEEQKLKAILDAQYAQLSALDSEVVLSAAEIQVKAAEADAMREASSKADSETREAMARQEATRLGATFKPMYSSILLYVREEPLQP